MLQKTAVYFSPVVKIEESLGWIHTKAGCHILIVGQCGTEADEPHVFLGQLHIADGSSNQGLQNRPTVIMQQVDLILYDRTC